MNERTYPANGFLPTEICKNIINFPILNEINLWEFMWWKCKNKSIFISFLRRSARGRRSFLRIFCFFVLILNYCILWMGWYIKVKIDIQSMIILLKIFNSNSIFFEKQSSYVIRKGQWILETWWFVLVIPYMFTEFLFNHFFTQYVSHLWQMIIYAQKKYISCIINNSLWSFLHRYNDVKYT